MPIQVGSTVTDFNNATPTSLTTSYTQVTGANLVLVVMVGTEADVAHSSVTFDGVAMTKQIELGAVGRRTSIWTLVNPNVTTANIVVSLGAAADVGMIATSWQDVHQTTPVPGTDSASGTSTTPSITVPSAAGELVIDAVNNGADAADPTVGAGQTEIADVNVIGDFRFHASQQAGAAPNVVMDWTITSTQWVSCGISLQPPVPGLPQSHEMIV